MPFKVGDCVRLIEDYGTHLKGEEGTVTKVYDSTHPYGNRVSQQLVCCDNMSVFDFRLELVPAELRFEVGKKYKGRTSIDVSTCLFADEEGGLLSYKDGSRGWWKNVYLAKYLEEYIPEPPKPVHKEGWIRVYMDRTIRDKVGSILYDTENEALQLTSVAALKGRSVSGVRAFKIEWDEVPEASEDDTI